MARPLTDLSFEEWINYAFDRPVRPGENAWYWQDYDWWEPEPGQAVAYLTQLFERSGDLLEYFTDDEIGQGLWYLVDNSCGGHCRFLIDGSVPIEDRVACIEAMRILFTRVFEPRCPPILSHLSEPGGNRLSYICFMWWDLAPFGATSRQRHPDPTHDACLDVMRATLRLSNPACQESALHGLGHFAHAYREFTAATIDAYLAANPKLRPELVRYAQAARSGCIQ
ncbi:MAG TPA: hypothetical protein VJV39_10210 [Dongiaceae bacterium]|nr:hypothetical protein [Dongiaceae bacterium]